MKAVKWRELSEDEVRQKVRELSEEIFNLRFQLSLGVAKNPSRVGEARRDLARAYTILREKGIAPGAVAVAAEAPAPSRTAAAPKARAARTSRARPRAAATSAPRPAAAKRRATAKKKG
jgi:large subunit ribosomal protein L29